MHGYVHKEDVVKIVKAWNPDERIVKAIKGMLDASVRQDLHGEWVDIGYDREFPIGRRFRCSSCGDYQTYGRPKYCPNCGARMTGEKRGK